MVLMVAQQWECTYDHWTVHLLNHGYDGKFYVMPILPQFFEKGGTTVHCISTYSRAVFFLNFIYLFIYLFISWLCWVFVSVGGLPLVAASGGHSSSRCAGLSPSRPLLLRSTGSRRSGSVVVAHGPSCSGACGILPEPGLEPVSPALAGRFSTTAPPGKPLPELFWCDHFNSFWS